MTGNVRVMVERGNKRVVAVAFDWVGWERSGASEEDALRVLELYRPRYATVADHAGMGDAFAAAGELEVVERLDGTGTTDFYGISARSATAEREPMSDAECERKIALLRAAWAYFDSVLSRVSAELRKGPRGGGRDREKIALHVRGSEREFARTVGVRQEHDAVHTPDGLRLHRAAFVEGIREANRRGPLTRTSWTLQFTIRRSAYHLLDHAWEMEDRDLSSQS